jgi:hypothetical protein
MDTKSLTPTYANSLWATPVGSHFYATDRAGLTASPELLGICVTRTGSETWDLDTFRVHSEGPADKIVRVDRWPITATGSCFFRSGDRHFPPDPPGGPSGSGHYPGALPQELLALITNVSSKQS